MNADGRNRGHFFLIFLSPRAKLLTPDWSRDGDAKLLSAPDWLCTPFLHFFGFFILCRDKNDFFEVLWSLPKILGNQVIQLQRKFLKVNFRFLQETARDYLCQKLKT